MSIADEAVSAPGNLQTALDAGLDSLSRRQQVTFKQYTKQVLASDGYVFWVATGNTLNAVGSLHYATDTNQEEDQTIGINQLIFTAEEQIAELNAINPGTMWVGQWMTPENVTILLAFSRHGMYYEQAGVWHYSGDAIYPALAAQLVNSPADLPVGPIVSNSLPIWLGQNSMAPVYPSYLVGENIKPPYVAVHIGEDDTEAIQAFPGVTWPGVTESGTGTTPAADLHSLPSDQLMKDKVRLTLYGFTNDMAVQFLFSLMDYSTDTDDFGFMNMPAIKDAKRIQPEITAIAQKKIIDIVASYNRAAADSVARRLILSASISIAV